MYINGAYYGIHPTTYVQPFDPNDRTYCFLTFFDGKSEFLLGEAFLRSYYSIWDDDNSQIAFLPHHESNATVTVGPAPTDAFVIPKDTTSFSYV